MMNKPSQSIQAVLEPLLNDPSVMAILIDSYDKVYVRRGNHNITEDVPSPFRSNEHLTETIQAFAAETDQPLDRQHPFLEARLPDGSRMLIVMPPVSIYGPAVTVNKFSSKDRPRLTIDDLLRFGSWSEEIVQFVQACVLGQLNIVVSGGTASGKTTVLELVAGMIPDDERIIVVETENELKLPGNKKRLIELQSGAAHAPGSDAVSLRDVVSNALRMLPDWLVVAELTEGDAASPLLEAVGRGYSGMWGMHANSPRDVLTRLETMLTSANPLLPLLNARQIIASAIHLILYQELMQDEHRRVVKISEVTGLQGDIIVLNDIFEFRQERIEEEGHIVGHFTATGHIPRFADRLHRAGANLPLSLFTPQ